MAAKTREILTALQAQLEGITQANGYTTDVDFVTFRLLTPEQITQDVTLCIVPGDTPLTPVTNSGYTSGRGGLSLDGWMINLLLYQRHGSDDTAESNGLLLLEDFISDVLNNLAQNLHIGLDYVGYVGIETVLRYPYVLENLSLASIVLYVKYDFSYGAA